MALPVAELSTTLQKEVKIGHGDRQEASCGYCGRQRHQQPSDCPDKGKVCDNCSKNDHFAKVCRSQQQQPNKQQRQQNSGNQSRLNTNSNYRSNNNYKNYSDNNKASNNSNNQSNQRRVRQVTIDLPQPDNNDNGNGMTTSNNSQANREARHVDEGEYVEFLRYKESLNYGINSIQMEPASLVVGSIRNNDGLRVNVGIQGTQIVALVDTGSPVYIIDEHALNQLAIKPQLDSCRTRFFGYTADEPIPVLGQFTSRMEYRGRSTPAAFIVVKGQHESLISFKTALDLAIIHINAKATQQQRPISGKLTTADQKWNTDDKTEPQAEVTASTREYKDQRVENLVSAFPKLFSGALGCIKGVKAKLDIDPSVKPVRQPQRPVPFHMRSLVEKELLKQEKQGIIERVTDKCGPTPSVANLVIVPKDLEVRKGKVGTSRPTSGSEPQHEYAIRITCDSRAQNKAIRRTRYPSRTVEDLIQAVNGAKMFSKLDITKAFHQLELDEESRNHTTITTHIGLFRYRRLHMGISCASVFYLPRPSESSSQTSKVKSI